ncbi:unnamed protein product [Prunus armeniaca]
MNLRDWGPKVDVVVFCFLDLASNYEPPDSLAEWLEAGEQPVYIGFDSWGGLGNLAEPSDSVYLVDNCPHDWLFQRCFAVVKEGAVEIAKTMDGEDGLTGAVNAFHRHFPHNKSEDKLESLPTRRGLFSIRRCFGYSSSYT